MSVSANRNVTQRSEKRSLREKDFRNKVSNVKKRSVSKPASVEAPAHLTANCGSLREEFIRALKIDDKSDRTIKSYCDAVKMFQNFIHKHPLNVTINDIRAFFFIS